MFADDTTLAVSRSNFSLLITAAKVGSAAYNLWIEVSQTIFECKKQTTIIKLMNLIL